LLLTLPAALWPCAPVTAQEESEQPLPLSERIDALFESFEGADTPGAAIAVIEDGELVHSRGYGIAQLEYEIEIGPETVFHVASVSKQFTAMAVILLALEGKLSLDDEVRQHLPWVPDFGVPITLQQLIHHTSGLRDQWESLLIAGWRLDDVITHDHIRAVVERQRELNFAPGERHLYCNTGYTLLAEVVAAVSGKSFPQFTRERIFEPLGMSSTHFHDDHEHVVPNRAYSYQPSTEGFRKSVLSYANAGATSLFTTAEDLVRWLENFDHHRVGGVEGFELLGKRVVLDDGKTLGYAGGILFGKYRGLETISHSGGDAGFRSHVVWFPERKLGIAVVSNHAAFSAPGGAMDIAALLVPEATKEKASSEKAPEKDPAPKPVPVEVPVEQLERLAGTYATRDQFSLQVQRRSSRLFFRIQGLPRRRLIPESPTSFRTHTGDVRLRFSSGEGDDPALELRVNDQVYALSRLPEGPTPSVELASFAGRYECRELEALYTIALEGDQLLVRHFRQGSFSIEPTWPDTFSAEKWYLRTLRFTRGDDGEIDGFRADGSRVLNLRFDRLPGR